MPFALGLALSLSAALSESSLQSTPIGEIMPEAQTVEEYVRDYFADIPVMIAVAQCESRFRQYDSAGRVLKNPTSSAIGIMQVMASIHSDAAGKLGFDITTTEGNLGYARHLYEQQGIKPWNASKSCWGKTEAAKQHLAAATK